MCYNIFSVGAGIPVGVYVFAAHKHQEMLSATSTSLPALFIVPAGRTRYFLLLYSSIIWHCCQVNLRKNKKTPMPDADKAGVRHIYLKFPE